MNSISIPKNIFEQVFFQEGGQKNEIYKSLTGQFEFELPKNSPIVNAEIEGGEHLKDSNGVRKALGKSHNEGGMSVHLENGARVISDHLKLGGEFARALKKEYDIDVKASDTYAKALDKYNKKIGLVKKTEEAEKTIKQLDEQKQGTKDEATLALNTEHLMNEIHEASKEIEPLEKKKEEMFNLLYTAQEDSKSKKENKDNFMQDGGSVQSLASKYNISEDKLKEILPQYQDGKGNVYSPLNPNNPLFVGQTSFDATQDGRISNRYEDPSKFIKQTEVGTGYFGDVVTYNSEDVQNQIKKLHPEIYSQYFKEGEIKPKDVKGFQQAIKSKYEKILTDAEKIYPKDSKEIQTLKTNIAKDTFLTDDSVKGLEGKFGNFTSTRPNFALNVLPKDVLLEVKNAGINTASELKKVFPEYHKQFVESKGLESDFWLGEQSQASLTPVNQPTQIIEEITQPLTPVEEARRSNTGMLLLPDQTPLSPPSMLAPAKFTPRVYGFEYAQISPEQQLSEISRSQLATQNQLAQLPDAQKAATLASMDANNAQNVSKIISDTNRYNAQAKERTDANQAQVMTQQSAADMSSASQYQQLMGREIEGYEADLQNYYNRLNENQLNNWKTIETINLSNAMNPNVQYTGSGYEVINTPTFTAPSITTPITPSTEQKKKPKKKSGGRFKK